MRVNYRSAQPILDSSHALMASDPLFGTRRSLQAWRVLNGRTPAVIERVTDSAEQEAAVIAHDILRLVRPARRLPRCARQLGRPHVRRPRPSLPALRVPRAFRDIAVLCRTHSQASRVATVLQAHGIPVDQAGELLDVPESKMCWESRRSSEHRAVLACYARLPSQNMR